MMPYQPIGAFGIGHALEHVTATRAWQKTVDVQDVLWLQGTFAQSYCTSYLRIDTVQAMSEERGSRTQLHMLVATMLTPGNRD